MVAGGDRLRGGGRLAQGTHEEAVDLIRPERREDDDVRGDQRADGEGTSRGVRRIVKQEDRPDRENERGDGEKGEVDEELRAERRP